MSTEATIERWQAATCHGITNPIIPPPKGFFPSGPWEPVHGSLDFIVWKRPLFRIPKLPQNDEKVMRSTFTEHAVSVNRPFQQVPEGWALSEDWVQVPYDETGWFRVLVWQNQWMPLV